jgi:hypothetical protein
MKLFFGKLYSEKNIEKVITLGRFILNFLSFFQGAPTFKPSSESSKKNWNDSSNFQGSTDHSKILQLHLNLVWKSKPYHHSRLWVTDIFELAFFPCKMYGQTQRRLCLDNSKSCSLILNRYLYALGYINKFL